MPPLPEQVAQNNLEPRTIQRTSKKDHLFLSEKDMKTFAIMCGDFCVSKKHNCMITLYVLQVCWW